MRSRLAAPPANSERGIIRSSRPYQDRAISASSGLNRSGASYCTQCPAPGITSKRAAGWTAQRAGAVVEMGVGRGIAFAPNPVETRLDCRQRSGERVGAGEPPAFDPTARRVVRLDIDRELVDFCGIGDHQRREIVARGGKGLGRRRVLRDTPQRCGLTHQTEAVRPDNRKAAHAIPELRGDMAAEHPPKEKPPICSPTSLGKTISSPSTMIRARLSAVCGSNTGGGGGGGGVPDRFTYCYTRRARPGAPPGRSARTTPYPLSPLVPPACRPPPPPRSQGLVEGLDRHLQVLQQRQVLLGVAPRVVR